MRDDVKNFMQIISQLIKTADYISFRVWHKLDSQKALASYSVYQTQPFEILIHLRIAKRRVLSFLSHQFHRLTILFVAVAG